MPDFEHTGIAVTCNCNLNSSEYRISSNRKRNYLLQVKIFKDWSEITLGNLPNWNRRNGRDMKDISSQLLLIMQKMGILCKNSIGHVPLKVHNSPCS